MTDTSLVGALLMMAVADVVGGYVKTLPMVVIALSFVPIQRLQRLSMC